MQGKWFDLTPRHNQPDGVHGNGTGNSKGKGEKENRALQATASAKPPADPIVEGVVSFQVELLPVDGIYRQAGIVNLRKGYSVNKVVEMLHSEHTCGLSKEARRAAVLMALEAAGVSIDEVLQETKARHNALDSYEAEQRKEIEAEWERKAEENVQMQAELERVQAHYIARMDRNLNAVAREKAGFNIWLATKQEESQRIAEAAELCVKSPVPEPAVSSLSAVVMAPVGRKPM